MSDRYDYGYQCGVVWAVSEANPAERSRLEQLRDALESEAGGFDSWFEQPRNDHPGRHGLQGAIAAVITDDQRADPKDFWFGAFLYDQLARSIQDAIVLRGFCDGALDEFAKSNPVQQ